MSPPRSRSRPGPGLGEVSGAPWCSIGGGKGDPAWEASSRPGDGAGVWLNGDPAPSSPRDGAGVGPLSRPGSGDVLGPGVALAPGVVGGVPYCCGLSSPRRLCISTGDGGLGVGVVTVAASLSKHWAAFILGVRCPSAPPPPPLSAASGPPSAAPRT